MPPQREFRIVAIVQKSLETSAEIIRRNEIRRTMFDRDLVADLDRFWRVTCELAEINQAIPVLQFFGAERARPVCMRVPPFEPHELPDAERAATILEALRKMAQR